MTGTKTKKDPIRKGMKSVLRRILERFEHPDEVKMFPEGKLELIKIGGITIVRSTFEPGWRWSASGLPLIDFSGGRVDRFQYHLSGTLIIAMDDDARIECKAGDISRLTTGHDAWVEGDEPVVTLEFQGMMEYARQPRRH
jgi:hypothetical protein